MSWSTVLVEDHLLDEVARKKLGNIFFENWYQNPLNEVLAVNFRTNIPILGSFPADKELVWSFSLVIDYVIKNRRVFEGHAQTFSLNLL